MNNKISTQELSDELALRARTSKRAAGSFVRTFFEHIYNKVLEEKVVKVKGLGTFKLVEVSDRESVNVNTGERFVIPGHSKVTFTPDNALRDRINKPFADFQTVIINPDTPLEAMEYLAGGEDATSETNVEKEEANEALVEEVMGEVAEETNGKDDAAEPIVSEEPTEEIQPEQEEAVTPQEEAIALPEEKEETTVVEEEADAVLSQEKVTETKSEEVETPTSEEEKDDTEDVTPKEGPKRKGHGMLYAAITVVLMVISFLAGSYLKLPITTSDEKPMEKKAVVEQPKKKAEAAQPTKAEADTAKVVAKEEVKENIPANDPKADEAKLRANAATYKQVPGGRYLIVGTKGTHVMRPGDGLYRLARNEYGGNEFAQYIIVHNDLADPNNVPIGYEIKLPELIKSNN